MTPENDAPSWPEILKAMIPLYIMWFAGFLLAVMVAYALATGRIYIKYQAHTDFADSPTAFVVQVVLMVLLGLPLLGFSSYAIGRIVRRKLESGKKP